MYEQWYCPNTKKMHLIDAQNPPEFCTSCGKKHIIGYYLNGKGIEEYQRRNWWYKKVFLEDPHRGY